MISINYIEQILREILFYCSDYYPIIFEYNIGDNTKNNTITNTNNLIEQIDDKSYQGRKYIYFLKIQTTYMCLI